MMYIEHFALHLAFLNCSYYYHHYYIIWTNQTIAQLVKNPPAMQETPVQFLSWEDLLEKG